MNALERLVHAQLGGEAAHRALAVIEIDPAIDRGRDETCSRAAFAMALGVCLFDALLAGVPSAAAYVADRRAAGERVRFDHGAIRTISFADGPTGALPAGQEAFGRILEPLGYAAAGIYPLPRLGMTGHVYCHRDDPETIPQYFVSELHVERFGDEFAATAHHVFDSSRDPLGADTKALLALFAEGGEAPLERAIAAMPEILAAFGRQHEIPSVIDYEALLAHSPEAAWIATEGNAFNHATDRVDDVEKVAAEQRALGRPIKDQVEISASGRVRQTAFRADPVRRRFRGAAGQVEREVPGSFYEFITRDPDPATGRLDLAFDSGNATGIFGMTKTA